MASDNVDGNEMVVNGKQACLISNGALLSSHRPQVNNTATRHFYLCLQRIQEIRGGCGLINKSVGKLRKAVVEEGKRGVEERKEKSGTSGD